MTATAHMTGRISDTARARLLRDERGPMLVNDWLEAVFIHLECDADALQPHVPYPLDLHQGRAFVSLVAFTMRRLRLARGGRLVRWATAPFDNHGFLNVRAYVKHNDEPGIYFLAEWLPNALSVLVGPRMFGLPYRFGRLDYEHDGNARTFDGEVAARGGAGRLHYTARGNAADTLQPCDEPSLTSFLLERYTCFTERRGVRRRFRVWHEPWPQVPIDATLHDRSLCDLTGDWALDAHVVSAHYSPGVEDVWIGRPLCIEGPACATTWQAPDPRPRKDPRLPRTDPGPQNGDTV